MGTRYEEHLNNQLRKLNIPLKQKSLMEFLALKPAQETIAVLLPPMVQCGFVVLRVAKLQDQFLTSHPT